MSDFAELEKTIAFEFKNKKLLEQALVHRSYLNENPNFGLEHNERLEFLGDAVLELVVTQYLYNTYPNPEGELTNWRASLVNAVNLATIGHEINLEAFLFLSRGERKDKNQKARNYILANAIEALIGAIYLDSGYDAAKDFISTLIISKLAHILENELYRDPKTKFQEASQEKMGITPTYTVISESGPDHNKTFTVGVFLNDEKCAEGDGTSKQEAETSAAANALKAKAW